MRSANLHQTRRSSRGKLSATAAACALLAAAGLLSGGAASASAGHAPRQAEPRCRRRCAATSAAT